MKTLASMRQAPWGLALALAAGLAGATDYPAAKEGSGAPCACRRVPTVAFAWPRAGAGRHVAKW